jgi:hypothetical protein
MIAIIAECSTLTATFFFSKAGLKGLHVIYVQTKYWKTILPVLKERLDQMGL